MKRRYLRIAAAGGLAGLAILAILWFAAIAPLRTRPKPTPTVVPQIERAPSPAPTSSPTAEDPYRPLREAMVEEQIAQRGVTDPAVLDVMRRVPRHRFVPPQYLDAAYGDHPLPIGLGQTISQPYIVALMTEALRVGPGARVLEIGTGSGYQAAVLAELGVEVYTVEIIGELADRAAARLAELGYGQVKVLTADGYFGWPEHAPYDAIIVTAAPPRVPPALIRQLAEGGRLVIPVGPELAEQALLLIERRGGRVYSRTIAPVRFVPLLTPEKAADQSPTVHC